MKVSITFQKYIKETRKKQWVSQIQQVVEKLNKQPLPKSVKDTEEISATTIKPQSKTKIPRGQHKRKQFQSKTLNIASTSQQYQQDVYDNTNNSNNNNNSNNSNNNNNINDINNNSIKANENTKSQKIPPKYKQNIRTNSNNNDKQIIKTSSRSHYRQQQQQQSFHSNINTHSITTANSNKKLQQQQSSQSTNMMLLIMNQLQSMQSQMGVKFNQIAESMNQLTCRMNVIQNRVKNVEDDQQKGTNLIKNIAVKQQKQLINDQIFWERFQNITMRYQNVNTTTNTTNTTNTNNTNNTTNTTNNIKCNDNSNLNNYLFSKQEINSQRSFQEPLKDHYRDRHAYDYVTEKKQAIAMKETTDEDAYTTYD